MILCINHVLAANINQFLPVAAQVNDILLLAAKSISAVSRPLVNLGCVRCQVVTGTEGAADEMDELKQQLLSAQLALAEQQRMHQEELNQHAVHYCNR